MTKSIKIFVLTGRMDFSNDKTITIVKLAAATFHTGLTNWNINLRSSALNVFLFEPGLLKASRVKPVAFLIWLIIEYSACFELPFFHADHLFYRCTNKKLINLATEIGYLLLFKFILVIIVEKELTCLSLQSQSLFAFFKGRNSDMILSIIFLTFNKNFLYCLYVKKYINGLIAYIVGYLKSVRIKLCDLWATQVKIFPRKGRLLL